MRSGQFLWLLMGSVGAVPLETGRRATEPDSNMLMFGPGGELKVTIFEDLHFGEGERSNLHVLLSHMPLTYMHLEFDTNRRPSSIFSEICCLC